MARLHAIQRYGCPLGIDCAAPVSHVKTLLPDALEKGATHNRYDPTTLETRQVRNLAGSAIESLNSEQREGPAINENRPGGCDPRAIERDLE
jgi:hypothetical protein